MKVIETASTADRDLFLFGLIHSDVSILIREIGHLQNVYENAGESYQAQQNLLKFVQKRKNDYVWCYVYVIYGVWCYVYASLNVTQAHSGSKTHSFLRACLFVGLRGANAALRALLGGVGEPFVVKARVVYDYRSESILPTLVLEQCGRRIGFLSNSVCLWIYL